MPVFLLRREKGSMKTLSSVEVGDIVAALYADDDCWYRGRVLNVSVSDPDSYRIYFVDYGNTELVKTYNLAALSSDMTDFPVQAVHCVVSHVLPT